MARPQSKGLSYFPLVTEWDTKAKLVHAKYGLLGIGCLIALYQDIYREGYALKWDEDTELLFSATNKIPVPKLREIIKFSIERGIFDNGVLDKYKTLTSHGIQKQWVAVAKASHRKIIAIDPNLCLLSPDELITEKTQPTDSGRGVSSGGNESGDEITQEEMPQSKVNKSKVNKEEITPEFSTDFLTFYDSYPRHEGKRAASKTYNAKVKRGATHGDIMASLAVYKSQIERNHTETKFVKLPATFLNCYDEYKPAPQPARPPRLGLRAGLTCPICGNPLITGDTGCRKCYAGQYRGIPDEMFEVIQ